MLPFSIIHQGTYPHSVDWNLFFFHMLLEWKVNADELAANFIKGDQFYWAVIWFGPLFIGFIQTLPPPSPFVRASILQIGQVIRRDERGGEGCGSSRQEFKDENSRIFRLGGKEDTRRLIWMGKTSNYAMKGFLL